MLEYSGIGNKDNFDMDTFEKVDILDSREPGSNFDDALLETIRDRSRIINVENKGFDITEEEERPKTFIREYLIEERKRIQTLQLKSNNTMEDKPIINKVKRQKGKCYTCHPRKKVLDHTIQNVNGVSFHHDMCNRNMIIATPNNHYTSIGEVPSEEIGLLFYEIDRFCRNWNICDYSVSYHQGSWQTHKHFHVKLKTYEHIVKRMRGDHFRMLSLQKEYNAV